MDGIEKGLKQLYFYEYGGNIKDANNWKEELYCLLDYVDKVHNNTSIKITQQEIQKEIRDLMEYYNSAEDKNLGLDHIELELRRCGSNISLESIHKSVIGLDIICDDMYCKTKTGKDILSLLDNKDSFIDISLPIFILLKDKHKKNKLNNLLEVNFLKKGTYHIDYRKVDKLSNSTGFLIPMHESTRNDRIVDKLLSQ